MIWGYHYFWKHPYIALPGILKPLFVGILNHCMLCVKPCNLCLLKMIFTDSTMGHGIHHHSSAFGEYLRDVFQPPKQIWGNCNNGKRIESTVIFRCFGPQNLTFMEIHCEPVFGQHPTYKYIYIYLHKHIYIYIILVFEGQPDPKHGRNSKQNQWSSSHRRVSGW